MQSIALFAGAEQRVVVMKVGRGWARIASCPTAESRNVIQHRWDRKEGKQQHSDALCVALLCVQKRSIVLKKSKLSSLVEL